MGLLGTGDTLVGEFIEDEGSHHRRRRHFGPAIASAERHHAVLVIPKFRAIHRSVTFVERLRDADVDFSALDMPEANRATIASLAMAAVEYRRGLSARIRKSLQTARERGRRLGNPEIALARPKAVQAASDMAQQRIQELRRQVVELRKEGRSLRAIADELNGRRTPTSRGREWHASSVRNILARGFVLQGFDRTTEELKVELHLEPVPIENSAHCLTLATTPRCATPTPWTPSKRASWRRWLPNRSTWKGTTSSCSATRRCSGAKSCPAVRPVPAALPLAPWRRAASLRGSDLVHVRPMDAAAAAGDLPMAALLWRSIVQSGVPPQRSYEPPTVLEHHHQILVAALNVSDLKRSLVNRQNTHAKPPGAARGSDPQGPRSQRLNPHRVTVVVSDLQRFEPDLDRPPADWNSTWT